MRQSQCVKYYSELRLDTIQYSTQELTELIGPKLLEVQSSRVQARIVSCAKIIDTIDGIWQNNTSDFVILCGPSVSSSYRYTAYITMVKIWYYNFQTIIEFRRINAKGRPSYSYRLHPLGNIDLETQCMLKFGYLIEDDINNIFHDIPGFITEFKGVFRGLKANYVIGYVITEYLNHKPYKLDRYFIYAGKLYIYDQLVKDDTNYYTMIERNSFSEFTAFHRTKFP